MKHLVKYLQVPKDYEHSYKFQEWHSWVMGHVNSNKKMYRFNCLIEVKRKTRQSSNTDISDFKLECAIIFLMKFC